MEPQITDTPLPEKKEEPTIEPTIEKVPEKSEKPEKGTQTPDRNLYAALEEERRLRKEREKEIESLKQAVPPSNDVFSDEGLALKREIDALKAEVEARKQGEELGRVFTQFPAIQESSEEFEMFRKEYQNVPVEKVAKLFMSEKGLIPQERKGLEKTSGGTRQPATSQISVEDVARLRQTNFSKYVQLVAEGKIRSEDIK